MLSVEGGKLCCSGAFLLTLGFLSLAPSPLLGVLAIAVGSVLFLLGTRRVAVELSSPGVFRSFLYGFVFMFLSILAGLYAFGSLAPLALLLFAALYVAIWYVLTEAEYLLSTLRLGRAFWEFAEYSFYMLFGSMTLVLLFIMLTYVLPREVDSLLAVVLAALLAFSTVLVAMFKLLRCATTIKELRIAWEPCLRCACAGEGFPPPGVARCRVSRSFCSRSRR